jgi:hypothetical protein
MAAMVVGVVTTVLGASVEVLVGVAVVEVVLVGAVVVEVVLVGAVVVEVVLVGAAVVEVVLVGAVVVEVVLVGAAVVEVVLVGAAVVEVVLLGASVERIFRIVELINGIEPVSLSGYSALPSSSWRAKRGYLRAARKFEYSTLEAWSSIVVSSTVIIRLLSTRVVTGVLASVVVLFTPLIMT